jgi:5-methyltetrahydrofolate--homocysteine methyltransferase
MLGKVFDNILAGNAPGTAQAVEEALNADHDPGDILNQAMIAAMTEIGRRYEVAEVFVPEMLIAARAMQAGLGVLRPHLLDANIQPMGQVVIGTVEGDLHDIGKNLVGMMLEGAGFEVFDLGTDVKAQAFVEAVKEHQPTVLGMSALLTTTMVNMRKTIAALEEAGVRDNVTVMVGGAPLTQKFADEIGADIFARDASSAAKLARALVAQP